MASRETSGDGAENRNLPIDRLQADANNSVCFIKLPEEGRVIVVKAEVDEIRVIWPTWLQSEVFFERAQQIVTEQPDVPTPLTVPVVIPTESSDDGRLITVETANPAVSLLWRDLGFVGIDPYEGGVITTDIAQASLSALLNVTGSDEVVEHSDSLLRQIMDELNPPADS